MHLKTLSLIAAAAAITLVSSSLTEAAIVAPANVTYQIAAPSSHAETAADTNRFSSMGSGSLSDGIVGDNTWVNSQSFGYYYLKEGAGIDGGVITNGNDPVGTVITFNLGAVYDLSSLSINFYDASGVGVSIARNISISDGVNTVTDSTNSAAVSGSIAPTYYNQYAQAYIPYTTVDLSALAPSQTFTLTLKNTAYQSSPGVYADAAGWIGLNEVNFNIAESTAVPEPASMGLLALGGLAALRRRRA
jgi:hypothetical protein